jgi:hypothetical protein
MPLLTELGNFLGCDFYKYVAPERGLVDFRLAALPHAAAAGVIFPGQNFQRARRGNWLDNRESRKYGQTK